MTPDEIKTVLADLAQRQRIDTIDQMAFAQLMAQHDTPTVFRALAQIRQQQPYINPSDLNQALNSQANTHADHVMQLLADGKFRSRLNPNDFPDTRSYQAARSVSPAMRNAYAHQARQIYLEAWRNQTQTPDRPALTVVPNTGIIGETA